MTTRNQVQPRVVVLFQCSEADQIHQAVSAVTCWSPQLRHSALADCSPLLNIAVLPFVWSPARPGGTTYVTCLLAIIIGFLSSVKQHIEYKLHLHSDACTLFGRRSDHQSMQALDPPRLAPVVDSKGEGAAGAAPFGLIFFQQVAFSSIKGVKYALFHADKFEKIFSWDLKPLLYDVHHAVWTIYCKTLKIIRQI